MEPENRVSQFFRKIKNNKIISLVIIIGTIVIAIGKFTDAVQSIMEFLGKEVYKETSSSSEEVEEPLDIPDAPEVPLKVLDYSSQKDASWPASAVTDGRHETAWVSKPSSPSGQSLVLSIADETLFDISVVQLCTASARSQQAAMAVRSVTLFSSQELEESRTLMPIGTYSFPQERTCHYLSLAEPRTLRVLVIQITENAGDPSVFVSEVTAYGHKHE